MFNVGGKIMEFGNEYIGCTIDKGYISFYLFPLGIEIVQFGYQDLELNLILWPINIKFGIGKNRTLFDI
jgi:hypothetical protein